MKNIIFITLMSLATTSSFISCKNRDINEGAEFRVRELHDDFNDSHFTRIKVDGIEYLMMERDNNNPHEGFGFMAFRANDLMEKQDTLMAYLQTVQEMQLRLYAELSNRSLQTVRSEADTLFSFYLQREQKELDELEKTELKTNVQEEDSE